MEQKTHGRHSVGFLLIMLVPNVVKKIIYVMAKYATQNRNET